MPITVPLRFQSYFYLDLSQPGFPVPNPERGVVSSASPGTLYTRRGGRFTVRRQYWGCVVYLPKIWSPPRPALSSPFRDPGISSQEGGVLGFSYNSTGCISGRGITCRGALYFLSDQG